MYKTERLTDGMQPVMWRPLEEESRDRADNMQYGALIYVGRNGTFDKSP